MLTCVPKPPALPSGSASPPASPARPRQPGRPGGPAGCAHAPPRCAASLRRGPHPGQAVRRRPSAGHPGTWPGRAQSGSHGPGACAVEGSGWTAGEQLEAACGSLAAGKQGRGRSLQLCPPPALTSHTNWLARRPNPRYCRPPLARSSATAALWGRETVRCCPTASGAA